MKSYPSSRKANIVIQDMDNEILIYDLTSNKAFCLNETSAIVWQLCDGKRSIEEISEKLGQKLNSPANEDLVWFALNQLKKEKLIENEITIPTEFKALSRREVVKKVGLGTMIALPLVSSLIAPTAVQAGGSVCDTSDMFCLCLRATALNNGDSCGNGDGGDTCNVGCTCTRNTTSGGCFFDGGIGDTVCPGACS